MTTRAELMDAIKTHLHNMILDRHLEPENVGYIIPYLEELIANRDKELIDAIAVLVKDWEQAMGPEDKSLYTLGLRRVIDMVREENYKPLDKDYRKNTSSEG